MPAPQRGPGPIHPLVLPVAPCWVSSTKTAGPLPWAGLFALLGTVQVAGKMAAVPEVALAEEGRRAQGHWGASSRCWSSWSRRELVVRLVLVVEVPVGEALDQVAGDVHDQAGTTV